MYGRGAGIVMGFAALATCYCLWVWFRKLDAGVVGGISRHSDSVSVPRHPPVIVAIYLPLVAAIQSLPAK